ncbi:hypothetical protein A4H97_22920 [Niastella yeongjuensis]|uniref:Peptidase S9 prolyl oligopeptidase catalytic domain-containing protein n=1 Tax=Niastella yeongjuensis TaxID=354355 RepID=A0A1V9F7K7_9BACT|nr:hypothetical protein [Niastella yeongjuensis]OQP54338.1 hypothetical protein A4H97_22920 [Niastella yeongjuensis]SEP29946.1 Dipeptidyl aminopeptidase/acylaminoacyl peptidase [Niastella yeongjuensis]
MKRFFLIYYLKIFSVAAYAQSIVTPVQVQRINLKEYVWSQAHANLSKNDKPLLDFNAIDNWPLLGNYRAISRNGKYFAYTVDRGTSWESRKLDSLVVQSTVNSWRVSFKSAKPGFFSGDSKQYIYKDNDQLCFLQMANGLRNCVLDVISFKKPDNDQYMAYLLANGELKLLNFITGQEKRFDQVYAYTFDKTGKWLACQIKNEDTTLVLYEISTGKEKRFNGVNKYELDNSGQWIAYRKLNDSTALTICNLATGIDKHFPFVSKFLFNAEGNSLVLESSAPLSNLRCSSLQFASPPDGEPTTIWSNTDTCITLGKYIIDKSGYQVAFVSKDFRNKNQNRIPRSSIWYYKAGKEKAEQQVIDQMGPDSLLMIQDGTLAFVKNYRYVIFSLKSQIHNRSLPNPDLAGLDIWSNKDTNLQSTQPYLSTELNVCQAILNPDNGRVTYQENQQERLFLLGDDFAIIKKSRKSILGDRFWEQNFGKDSNWLVSLKNGVRITLPVTTAYNCFWFSPGGKYLVYFDAQKQGNYFSYELSSGKLANISSRIPRPLLELIDPFQRPVLRLGTPFGVAAWLKDDKGIFIYDNYDIWKLDLSANYPAVNVTNSYGRFNKTLLALMDADRGGTSNIILAFNDTLLLRAFNTKNKYNGYFRKIEGAAGDPELLNLGPWFIERMWGVGCLNVDMHPLKANNDQTWIIMRQTAKDAPNYYVTKDFVTINQITYLQPQRRYSWLTTELASFKHVDGIIGEGVLYKPENFDSSKKYPVLIAFYGASANNLYQFPAPAYNINAITPGQSPIWFINNGYLIFIPDIYVSPLKYGPEAFNVIEGAARYLKHLPFVDSTKLGCGSHSWSAKLGAYVFTHSRSFAATAISEGFLYADMINVAFSTEERGLSRLGAVEKDFQFGSLWENKDSWLDQTTILHVDKANSPLLLFCNRNSIEEYQNQTVQLFTALWRLEKKVWWLKYDKGEHNLFDLQEQKDYTIRYTQFFDHYLKGAPAPRWMTQGIPYSHKGIESKYELDPTGTCAVNEKNGCSICKKWNNQYVRTPQLFNKPISEWKLDEKFISNKPKNALKIVK